MAADDDGADSVVNGGNQPDYSAVNIPDDTPRSEYSYVERRAELLNLIERHGAPSALNQSELAGEYGVSQQQISKDFKRLSKHIHDRLADRERRALIVDSAVKKAIEGLMDRAEYRKAAKTALQYDEWIYNFSDIEELENRLDEIESRK